MPGLRYYGDPVLRRTSAPVERFDDALRDLATEMLGVMGRARGVGLAANQVGVARRVIVVDLSGGESPSDAFVLVNPRITRKRGAVTDEEGCLSLPGLRLPVKRALEVSVEGRDLAGNPVVHEARGLFARVLQHEIDHLNGTLFVDRLPWRERIRMWFRLPGLKRKYAALRAASE